MAEVLQSERAGGAASPLHRRLLWIFLGLYFALLLAVNLGWVCYPTDNDLDDIGWIAAHQRISQPETLANPNQPLGFPLLLRLSTPLFGSLLKAAFFWASLGAVACLYLVFRLSFSLYRSPAAAWAALICGGLLLFPLATSEFPDGLTTALVLAGLLLTVTATRLPRAFLAFGFLLGVVYLFRQHYTTLLLVVPLALPFYPCGWRSRLACVACFWAGFVVGGLPLLVINTMVYGHPLNTGYNAQMLPQFAVNFLDHENFLATHNLWSLKRVILERPGSLLALFWDNATAMLDETAVIAALVFVPLTAALEEEPRRRRLTIYLSLVALLYACTTILPSRLTVRAFAPVTCLICVLSFPAVTRLAGLFPPAGRGALSALGRLAWLAVVLVLGFYGTHNPVKPLAARHALLAWNRDVLAHLQAAGYRTGDALFCNSWYFYPLQDPQFRTFHNYGGYMLLDKAYREARPRPDARTAAEWDAFLERQGIRYAVMKERPNANDFIEHHEANRWQEIYADPSWHVLVRR